MGSVYTIGMVKDIIHEQVKNALIKDGQNDVGVQWVQPLLFATAKPVALRFQH
ncbi:hypothetical protein QUF64_12290 [Anaerolineales bacterium HSG6]|nr:hypothetical protein [Anaerolineales bacterium HSG6]